MTKARNDLLSIRGMTRGEVEALLASAAAHKRARREGTRRDGPLSGQMVANLFFEDSTRTRSSFEIAARALGANVLGWSAKESSVAKGETLLDTARNLDAMSPAGPAGVRCHRPIRAVLVAGFDGGLGPGGPERASHHAAASGNALVSGWSAGRRWFVEMHQGPGVAAEPMHEGEHVHSVVRPLPALTHFGRILLVTVAGDDTRVRTVGRLVH